MDPKMGVRLHVLGIYAEDFRHDFAEVLHSCPRRRDCWAAGTSSSGSADSRLRSTFPFPVIGSEVSA